MNTTFNDVYQRLIPILIDKFAIDESEITHDLSFQDDLGADSLDRVELIMEVEDEFNISITDDESDKVITVSDAVICIMKALGKDMSDLLKRKGLAQVEISSCSQLERDMRQYANDAITKGDIMLGLKLLSEVTGGIAVFGIVATALTSWAPGLGIPISAGTASMIMRNIAKVYINLPTDDRRLIAKCANFFSKII